MAYTLPGWIAFAAMLACAGSTSAMATKLILNAMGRASLHPHDIPMTYTFAALMCFSTALFVMTT